MTEIIKFIVIGLAAGLFSGFFGIGGGLIIVPMLVFLNGFTQQTAVGTSLSALLLPVGIGAVMEYHKHGYVNFKAAAIIAVTLTLAAWFSSHFATRIQSGTLKLCFALFLITVGVIMAVSSIKKML